MRRCNPFRFVPILGMSSILTAIGLINLSSAARSQESGRRSEPKTLDGIALLTSRGLTRVANLYLLKDEIDAKDAIKEGEDALKRMEALAETQRQTIAQNQERLASLDEELSTQKQERNNLNVQKQRLSDQYDASTDANTRTFIKNQMQQIDNQVREKQDSIDLLNRSYAQTQSQLQTQQASLRELEAEYGSKKAVYERSFQYVKAKYQPLMKDREVIEWPPRGGQR
jgi:predicted  nucleic acid-binding Zn-ribbon protein